MGKNRPLVSFHRALAVLAVALLLIGTPALADVPWPGPAPGQDPRAYEEYCRSDVLPDDYSRDHEDFWMYTSEKSGNPLIDLNRREHYGVMGASVDKAWGVTTGRPDTILAVLDLGIAWHRAEYMDALRRKFHLNKGELPVSKGYVPGGAGSHDRNADGVFNITDYDDAGDFGTRVPDANSNGVLDPQDIIWRFADGVDDDGNGYVDDISGWDFWEDDNDPWDEVDDGHGTVEAEWSAGEADDGLHFPGACPNASLLMVRVSDANVADMNCFAQSVVFAVDSGASVILEPLGGLSRTEFGQAAIDYAWSKGTVVMAAAPDEQCAHQNFPTTYNHTVQVNSVTKYNEFGSFLVNQFPPSYLYLGGQTNYGAHASVATPSAGHSSGATGRAAGIAALVYSAAEDQVRKGRLERYPGLDKPISACEAKQLLTVTADDIDFSPSSYDTTFMLLDFFLGPSERFHSTPGWDPYFGYGRINAYKAVKAVVDGRIPPEADIREPSWFEVLGVSGSLFIRGRVAAVRAGHYNYSVEYAPGWNPQKGEWVPLAGRRRMTSPVDGVLAAVDLSEVNRKILETMEERGGEKDPNRYSFTVRVRVKDSEGNMGEDRKTMFCLSDPQAYPGTPRRLEADAAASPRIADIDDDGENELIVATGAGLVHAFNPDFSEASGWPVHTTPLSVHGGSPGYSSKVIAEALGRGLYSPVTSTPAVGDLDRDGSLEVVVGDSAGRLYAWDKRGRTLPGFPVRSNPLYSCPDRADWWTPGALPNDYYENRFVPDRKHRLNRWNCLDNGFMRGPALANLDGSPDGSLEIIAPCLDQHLYAWHRDGSPVVGWPVKLVDPGKVERMDPVTHLCRFADSENVPRGSKIVAGPSVADLNGDGRMEVVCGTNEGYYEAVNVSRETFGVIGLIDLFKPLIGGLFKPANTRVYAVQADGAAHGLPPGEAPRPDAVPGNAYLEGWPARLAMLFRGFPTIMEGVNGPAALADVDGDGKMEIGVSSALGPGYLLEDDASSCFGNGTDGLPKSFECDTLGADAESRDTPIICALGGGCFAELKSKDGTSRLSYASPSMGLGRGIDMMFPSNQTRSDDQLSAWSTTSGSMLDAFPRKVYDMLFFVSPSAADIDGDGSQEILAGSSYYDIHAVDGDGLEPDGWPKFSGGWSVATPAVGDLDGDGKREVVASTREGWLFAWRTDSRVVDRSDWPEYGHDSLSTGCLDTDARRPGKILDLKAELTGGDNPEGVRLTWKAPGDDDRTGTASSYDVRYSERPLDDASWREARRLTGEPEPSAAGKTEEMILSGLPELRKKGRWSLYFALRAVDDSGNTSALSNRASVSFGKEVSPPPFPGAPSPSRTWYLPEGSTGRDGSGLFETWVLLMNPGEEKATARLTYMTPGGAVKGPTLQVSPRSRASVNVAEHMPGEWSVSTEVESDRPVVCERSTYWGVPGEKRLTSHSSVGATKTAEAWYLPEGSTGRDESGRFETWVLVANPGDERARVRLSYITPGGQKRGPSFTLRAGSRISVDVADDVPGEWSVATIVESDRGVVAERATYWDSDGAGRRCANGSVGVPATK